MWLLALAHRQTMAASMPVSAGSVPVIASATHSLGWLGSGYELLEAKLDAIAQAQHTVRLEIYIYSDEEIGRRFRTALIDAAKRGVQVQLLVDAVGGMDLDDHYFAELSAIPGAAMKWFNEPSLGTWAFRDHRKLLVVDSTIAFVGGCNIAETYHGDGVNKGWRDGGLRIEGPVALELEAGFDEQFSQADEKQWRVLHKRRQHQKKKAPAPGSAAIRPLFIQPGFGHSPLRDAIRMDLAGAKDIAITSAYFLPSIGLMRQFSRAVHHGARMRLMLGGKTDVKLMQLATRALYPRLLHAGVEVYEYEPQILHAKLLVIDDHVYVGSSNLDPRSLRINFEIMVRIHDPALAVRARQQFEEDVERSHRVSLQGRRSISWWQKCKQRLAQWLLATVDPRLSEGMLRRLRRLRLRR